MTERTVGPVVTAKSPRDLTQATTVQSGDHYLFQRGNTVLRVSVDADQFAGLSRSEFVVQNNAGDFSTLNDGDVVWAGGLGYVRSTSATAISDIAGFVPLPPVRADHFADNTTPGTTDMTAAVQAQADYCLPLGQDMLNGPDAIALSDTVTFSGVIGEAVLRRKIGGNYVAIGAAWADDGDGYSKAMFHVDGASNLDLTDMRIDAKWLASGLLIENNENVYIGGNFIVQRWRVRVDDMSYGLRTKTVAGQLVICNGATARQYKWGDTNFDDQADRTGYGFKMETADFLLSGIQAYYTKFPVHIDPTGPWKMSDAHVFNGALTTVTDATSIYGVYVESPTNGVVSNVYHDNAKFYINADDLQASDFISLNMSNVYFHENANNDSDFSMEIHTTTAGNDLGGLHMANCIFNAANDVTLTTSGSGSFGK